MNGFADIVETRQVKDSEGFTHSEDEVLASVRVYREGRHAVSAGRTSPHSAKRPTCPLSVYSGADGHYRPLLICDDGCYDIVSVEDVKGRGMYIEVLAKKEVPTVG